MSAASLIRRLGVSVTILRPTTTAGSAGGAVTSYAAVTTLRMFVDPSGETRSESMGALRNTQSIRVFAPIGTDVRREDRLRLGSGATARILRVTGVVPRTVPGGGRLARIEIECYEEVPLQ